MQFTNLLKDIFCDTYLSLVSSMVYVRWGGNSCFEFKDSITVLTDPHDGARAKVVIPMHYHIDGIIFPYFPLRKIEEFAEGRSNVRCIGNSEACYSRDTLPEETVFDVFTL